MAFSSFFVSEVMVIVLTPLANKYGAYHVINNGTRIKVILGILMLLGGMRAWPWWSLLYITNVVVSKAVSGFYNLVFSDVIDEDQVRYSRRENLSASMHG